jgi:modification methylase
MTIWTNCYDDSHDGLIVEAAFQHPAKMSRGLVVRIFDYLLERGYLQRGDTVIDCFAGIFSTGIEGATRGCKVYGCELEAKFFALANENIELHRRMWEAAGDPIPVIVQGDSRKLCELLRPAMEAACVVSSPPYEGSFNGGVQENPESTRERMRRAGASEKTISKIGDNSHSAGLGYGEADGQIGNESGETFWEAAREIVAQCFQILRPGGIACWVTKNFVRNKKIVDFTGDWIKLCQSCGFVLVERIQASLVKEDSGADLFGGEWQTRTERKSFFRRLYEKKYPGNRIDHEDVIVMMKPDGNGGGCEAIVSSPPFGECQPQQDRNFHAPNDSSGNLNASDYGDTPGQLGRLKS